MKTLANKNAVDVLAGHVPLEGILTVPEHAVGIVVFAHGSGSSRFSPRNRFVANVFHGAGLATLLFDLLTPAEEALDHRTRRLRFDIPMLAERLVGAVDWLGTQAPVAALPIGLFGSSTGSAAALIAAASRPDKVAAVVSRGGRPDLARSALPEVKAPTLLIVGGDDRQVLDLNLEAARMMKVSPQLEVIPGASHLFEEPGKLEVVAEWASAWFRGRFPKISFSPPPH